MIKFIKIKNLNENNFIHYEISNFGESHQSKINKIQKILKLKKADYLFISSPENVAWLMNIRGFVRRKLNTHLLKD